MLKHMIYLGIVLMLSMRLVAVALQQPINAIYDSEYSRYLVTQSNNQLVALDKNMQNAVSLLNLDSPAELYIQNSKLYIADINKILEYDLDNMQELSRYDFNSDFRIKSITGGGGDCLFFVNSYDSKIYKYDLTSSELSVIKTNANALSIPDIDFKNNALYCAVIENNNSKIIKYDLQTQAEDVLYSNPDLKGLNCIAHDENNNIYAYYYGAGINKGVIRKINLLTKVGTNIKTNMPAISSLEYCKEFQSLLLTKTSENMLSLVLVGVATKPNLIFPLNNSSIEENMVVFRWESIPGVASYNFNVSEDSTFTNSVRSYKYQSNQSDIVVLDTSKVYYWKVQGENLGINGEWSDTFQFKSGNMNFGNPSLINPKANATNVGLQPTFVWSKSIAGIYALQISNKLDFSDLEYDVFNLTDTVFAVTQPLSQNTEYYWRVRAYSSLENPIVWSNFSSFRTYRFPPEAPELYYPLNNAINVSKTPILEWNTVANTDSFDLYLSENIGFPEGNTRTYEIEAKVNSPKQVLSIIDTLKNNCYYYWQVRGKDAFGVGEWSDTWGFQTLDSGENSGIILDNYEAIKTYPIPANDFIYANLPLIDEAIVEISLCNSLGISIGTPQYEIINQSNTIKISTADLASGVYYIIIKAEDKSYLLKVVKL